MSAYPKQLRAVINAAVIRAGTATNKLAAEMITSRYAVSKKEAKSRLHLRRSSLQSGYAIALIGRGSKIGLVRYHAKVKNIKKKPAAHYRRESKEFTDRWGRRQHRSGAMVFPKKTRVYRGVTVRVLRESGKTVVRGGFLGHAKRGAEIGTGAEHIFWRIRGSGKPGVKRGPSLVSLLLQTENTSQLLALARETLYKRLEHGADFYLAKLGGKS
jgi:hypothetical protein